MIGRAAIGNPWIFEQTKALMQGVTPKEITIDDRVNVCREHLLAAVDFKGERQAIFEMRKHYGAYFKGLFDFKRFRIPLVTVTTLDEVLEIFEKITAHYK